MPQTTDLIQIPALPSVPEGGFWSASTTDLIQIPALPSVPEVVSSALTTDLIQIPALPSVPEALEGKEGNPYRRG